MINFSQRLDAVAQALWPPSNPILANTSCREDDTCADLVFGLYAARITVTINALIYAAIMIFEAWAHGLTVIALGVALGLIPITLLRHLNMLAYLRAPRAKQLENAPAWQSRWMVCATAYTLTMSVISTLAAQHNDPSLLLLLIAISAGNTSVTATRTAPFRNYIYLQTFILTAPFLYILSSSLNIHRLLLAMIIIFFVLATLEVATRVRKETLTAHASLRREEELARYDSLTGLPNRNYFLETLKRRLAHEAELAVFFVDLDHFKGVNDTLGHAAGDQLLIMIAERLTALAKDPHTNLARVGGDEFLLLTSEDPLPIATSIVRMFSMPFILANGEANVGCSIGINTTEHSRDPEEMLRLADIALYEAKSLRANAIRVFDANMEKRMLSKIQLETRLRQAIRDDAITIDYQPIIDAVSGAIVSVEALARWNDAFLGVIPPNIFIAAAESMGIIDALGEQILTKACSEVAHWSSPILLAVNVSPLQLKDPTKFQLTVTRALAKSGLPSCCLELEITETAMLQNPAEARTIIQNLMALEIRIALDDFGSGYSGLAQLQAIPFSKIKIDRALTRDCAANHMHEIIIRMVSQIGQTLGCDIVAEGVESLAQSQCLRALGVTHFQGYFFGRPEPGNGRVPPTSTVRCRSVEAPDQLRQRDAFATSRRIAHPFTKAQDQPQRLSAPRPHRHSPHVLASPPRPPQNRIPTHAPHPQSSRAPSRPRGSHQRTSQSQHRLSRRSPRGPQAHRAARARSRP